jgi:predicted transcriptional regulator
MSGTKTCDNPKCICNPCTCAACGCGVARLGEAELRVMEILWAEPDRELTGRNVADLLPNYAYTTVATMLDRLVHKNLANRRLEGRTIRFTATGTRADHAAELMHETLVTNREPEAVLVRFATTMSSSEAAVLRQALDGLDEPAPPIPD